MKNLLLILHLLIFSPVWTFADLGVSNNVISLDSLILKDGDELMVKNLSKISMGLLLQKGNTIQVGGFNMFVKSLENSSTGTGVLYFPALETNLNVAFENLSVTSDGDVLAGEIHAFPDLGRSPIAEEASLVDLLVLGKQGMDLPLSIGAKLKEIKDFQLPVEADLVLENLRITQKGSFVDLAFSAPSLVEGDFLDFDGQNIEVSALDFCLNTDLSLSGGGGMIDDFEFPMRIVKGDPNEEREGSYVTFDCSGFQNFNLQAEYPFPNDQLIPAEEGVDTVVARFTINAPSLGNFMAFASVDKFEIPGADEMVFTIDSAYVDYSDVSNPTGMVYNDPVTESAVEDTWKGVYFKELSIALPSSISSFKDGEPLTIGGSNIVYDRGNGITADLFAYNLLDLSEGSLVGWGLSIDTLLVDIDYNSFKKLSLNGDLYIPLFEEGQNLNYEGSLANDENGAPSLVFAIDVAGEYNVPLLGNMNLTLEESSKIGVEYNTDGFEPYANFSGSMNIVVGGEGSAIGGPPIKIPGIGFQDFKLNDIEEQSLAAAGTVTGGFDRMSFGAISFAGLSLPDTEGAGVSVESEEEDAPEEESSVNGFPIKLRDFSFESVRIDGVEYKQLKFTTDLNLSKGKSGIKGELQLGLQGEVEYSKLLSTSPWDALTYDKTLFGSVAVDATFGPCGIKGVLNIFEEDAEYGTGFKGGVELAVATGGIKFKAGAIGQFGRVNDYNYFFVDIRTEFSPAIPMGYIDLIGVGGGVFVNMDKTYRVLGDEEYGGANADAFTAELGTSFSGSKYTPKNNTMGLSLAASIQQAGSPEVFNGDVEFSIQMSQDLAVEKIMLKGDGYFLAKNRMDRKDATIIAEVALVVDLVDKKMTCNFGFELAAPKTPVSFVTASGQGAIQIDLDPNDSKENTNFFYFGKPRETVTGKIDYQVFSRSMDAYVMIGEEMPEAVPLSEIHRLFSGFGEGSSFGNGFGVAFGVRSTIPRRTYRAGPIKASFSAVMGIDASIRQYPEAYCVNTGAMLGMEGWYVKGRAYLAMEGDVSIYVKMFGIEGDYNLMDIGIAAAVQAELPNPAWLRADLKVKGRILNGLVRVNTRKSFEIGEKCIMGPITDPSALIANISAIDKVYPDPESTDERTDFPVYEEPIISFAHKALHEGFDPEEEGNYLIVDPGEGPKLYFYPVVTSFEFKSTVNNEAVDCEIFWNETNDVILYRPKNLLDPQTNYTFRVKVNWKYRKGGGAWETVRRDDGSIVEEVKDASFKTGDRPEVVVAKATDAKRHFPGNMQRNYHRNFGEGAIFFNQGGWDYLFDDEKERTIDGITKMVKYDYEIHLTDMSNGEVETVRITEKPGNASFETLVMKSYTVQIQKDTFGNTTSVTYNKHDKVIENPKAIKFDQINRFGLLETATLYNFKIMGIPRQEDADLSTTVTASQVNQAVGDGIVISSVSKELENKANPFKIPEVLYEYHFRTSKYKTLQEKVQAMAFIRKEQSKATNGTTRKDLKDAEGGFEWEISNTGVDAKISDDCFVFQVDEGFDWWDRQRLLTNFLFEEPGTPREYQNMAHFANTLNTVQSRHLPSTWKKLLDPKPWVSTPNSDKESWWYYFDYPKNSLSKLTNSEITNRIPNSSAVASGLSESKSLNFGEKWDFAFVYKRRRVVTNQMIGLAKIEKHMVGIGQGEDLNIQVTLKIKKVETKLVPTRVKKVINFFTSWVTKMVSKVVTTIVNKIVAKFGYKFSYAHNQVTPAGPCNEPDCLSISGSYAFTPKGFWKLRFGYDYPEGSFKTGIKNYYNKYPYSLRNYFNQNTENTVNLPLKFYFKSKWEDLYTQAKYSGEGTVIKEVSGNIKYE